MSFWDDLFAVFRRKPKPPVKPPTPEPTAPIPPTPGVRVPSGYFVMQEVGAQNVKDKKLASPKFTGLVLRESWANLNPTMNGYNWRFLDEQFARCRGLGKQIILSIYTGSNAPPWITGPKFGPPGKMAPYPWSDAMLEALDQMLMAVGARYGRNPLLVGVELGGPTCPDMSIEMHFTNNVESLPGYSDLAMLMAWRRAAGSYGRAFGDVALISDGGPAPGGGRANITVDFWQYMRNTYGRQFFASHCSLKADTKETALHHRIVLAHKADGGRVLFEAVGPSLGGTDGENGPVARFGGPFADSVAIGKRAGMEAYKVYQGDEGVLPMPF